ncbi:MAG: DUF2357 domain-containing protein [Acholeplasmataceae bacterium]|nr:DUF2357 domain-containing protein [Acholeplasmataceae bacterium]
MEKKRIEDTLTSFYEEYRDENAELFEKDIFAQSMLKAIKSGDKELIHKNVKETKVFDEKWIETLESYFPSIDLIMRNPKSGLKYEDEVVAIEKARKVDAKSIRHLSANTHLIKEVKGEDIRPKKILTTYSEIDYQTYENRMVASLIDRLFYFVRSRYEVIKEFGDSYQNKTLSFKADFPLNEVRLSFDLKLNIKEEPEDASINKYNHEILERVKRLEILVSGFKRSKFMEALKSAPKVRTPIMKTTAIMQNPNYKNCYMLWLFLDRYNTLAFETVIEEKDMSLDGEYLESVYNNMIVGLSSILYYQEQRRQEFNIFDKIKKAKSIKVIKDLDVNPFLEEDIDIEDYSVNQFYLEQSRKLFEQALEYHESTSSTHEVALRKALRETLEFSNALYEDFFEFQKEDDIFRRLVDSLTPEEELTQLREMAKVAKIIREVKEVDYRKSVAFERRLLNRIAKLDQHFINHSKRGILSFVEMQKEEMTLKNEKERSLREAELLSEEIKKTQETNIELARLAKSVDRQFKKIERDHKRNLRRALRELERELRQVHQTKVKEIEEKHQIVIDNIEKERRERIEALTAKFVLAKERLAAEEAIKLKTKKEIDEQIYAQEIETLELKSLEEQERLKKEYVITEKELKKETKELTRKRKSEDSIAVKFIGSKKVDITLFGSSPKIAELLSKKKKKGSTLLRVIKKKKF